jgi:exosortase
MSIVATLSARGPRKALGWAPAPATVLVLAGLAILYVPVAVQFGGEFWWGPDDSHAGVVLLAVLWAYWRERDAFTWGTKLAEKLCGWTFVSLALVLYALGRVTNFFQLIAFSISMTALGLTLLSAGFAGARRFWILNFLLLFTVPVLGPFADTILIPLRIFLTKAAVHLFSELDFPISSSGVIITIGFVRLNILGACVGLRSMVSLIALGLIFLHLVPVRSWAHGLAFILLLPIVGLLANFLRICVLIAVANGFGASTESFCHDAAAAAEVFVAIGIFLGLAKLFERRSVAA